ncbi:MAG: hypothetical protein ABSF84_12260 [Acidimicrobiales bacterium]|jgi:hypothetical protein
MDRQNMHRAAQLLAKAQSTDFEAEAITLVEKCYVLLADVIGEFDEQSEPAKPRKRDRRHLRDRRATRRVGTPGTPRIGTDPAGNYRRSAEDLQFHGGGQVDLTA